MNKPSRTNSELYRTAKTLIPGGTQLLSKRPEMFAPDVWPAYYRKAKGCVVEDIDGRSFIDMSTNGIGSCLLGYADPDVTEAVVEQVQNGSMSSLNSPQEVELAEILTALHPWSDCVRYCRTGGEAMAIAVRLARAFTGRTRVAFCGYHGWHDWYLAANLADDDSLGGHLLPGLEPIGVPRGLANTSLPFQYNSLDQLDTILEKYGEELAAIVMEPTRTHMPLPGFLEGVRERCHDRRVVLIMDEISIGWRLTLGGAHLSFGIEPDIAVFAKALGNGHPMAAIVGREECMQAAQQTFISSTYWTESVGPVAAIATIRKMQSIDVRSHIADIGSKVMNAWTKLGEAHGLPVEASGHPALAHLTFTGHQAAELATLYTKKMLDLGILAGSGFYPTLAHTDEHVGKFEAAINQVFAQLSDCQQRGILKESLVTPVRHSGFQRLT